MLPFRYDEFNPFSLEALISMELEKLFTDLKKQLEVDGETSSSWTAVLWGREDLLGGAVEALLAGLDNWKTIRIFDERGIDSLIREAGRLHPDLLIVKQENIIRDIRSLLRVIQGFPDLRIITINPENNLIEVYDKRLRQIRDKADLLSVIDEHPKHFLKGGENGSGKTAASDTLQPDGPEESKT